MLTLCNVLQGRRKKERDLGRRIIMAYITNQVIARKRAIIQDQENLYQYNINKAIKLLDCI